MYEDCRRRQSSPTLARAYCNTDVEASTTGVVLCCMHGFNCPRGRLAQLLNHTPNMRLGSRYIISHRCRVDHVRRLTRSISETDVLTGRASGLTYVTVQPVTFWIHSPCGDTKIITLKAAVSITMPLGIDI